MTVNRINPFNSWRCLRLLKTSRFLQDHGRVLQQVSYSTQTQPSPKKRLHVPVMADQVIQYLKPSSGDTFIDMTFGAGGHTSRILQSAPNLRIFALDRDPVAHELAQEMAKEHPGQVIPLLGRFSELPELLKAHKVRPNSIDGFLLDFGCSSMQFDVAERGFSLVRDGPLDMRMNGRRCSGIFHSLIQIIQFYIN